MEGYKIFNSGLVNRYGLKFEEGKIYTLDITKRDISYGVNGYGYHFAKRLEDCLRYFDAMDAKVDIACVESLGHIREYYDDYYGYYDLYVTDSILIKHVLTREEIINYMLNTYDLRIERFVKGFRLNEDEIAMILDRYPLEPIYRAIERYQWDNEDSDLSTKIIKLGG